MSGSAELARFRAALAQAEADTPWLESGTAAQHQRQFAARNRANAARLTEAGFPPELAGTYLETARQHEATADRIEQEDASS